MAQNCCPVIHTRRVKVRLLMATCATSACELSSVPGQPDVHCVNVLLVTREYDWTFVMVSEGEVGPLGVHDQ